MWRANRSRPSSSSWQIVCAPKSPPVLVLFWPRNAQGADQRAVGAHHSHGAVQGVGRAQQPGAVECCRGCPSRLDGRSRCCSAWITFVRRPGGAMRCRSFGGNACDRGHVLEWVRWRSPVPGVWRDIYRACVGHRQVDSSRAVALSVEAFSARTWM